MVKERNETSAETGSVSNNPSKDESSKETDESKRKTPGVASAPTVRDKGSDLIPTQSGLSVSTTGHLTQALDETMQDPLVLEARVLEAKAPKIPPLKGKENKDLKVEVPQKNGGKPIETQDVIADQEVPRNVQKNSHLKMEAEVEVDKVEPEPTKPHRQMLKIPHTQQRKVLKAKSAKAAAKVQNNAMQQQGQAAVVEQTPATPANLQALGIDDTGPQWRRALIELTRINNQQVEYEGRFGHMEAQLNALKEKNKELTKLVSNGTARGEPADRSPSRPETENFVRHPQVSYSTPEGAQIAKTGKIPPETKAKEAGKQGIWKPEELLKPQTGHLHSKERDTLHLHKEAKEKTPIYGRGRQMKRNKVNTLSEDAKKIMDSPRFQRNMAKHYMDQVVDVQDKLDREFENTQAIRNAISTEQSQVSFRQEGNKVLLNMIRTTERGSPGGPRLVRQVDMQNIYGPGQGGPQLVYAKSNIPMSGTNRSSTQSAATSLEYEQPQDNPPERTLGNEGNRWKGNNQRPWKPRGNGRGRGGYRGNYRGNWHTHDGGNWSEKEHFPSWYDQPLQSWSPPSIGYIPTTPPVKEDFKPEVTVKTLEGYEGLAMCKQCNVLHKVNSYCPVNGEKIYSLNSKDL
jgi:hypothetical protein